MHSAISLHTEINISSQPVRDNIVSQTTLDAIRSRIQVQSGHTAEITGISLSPDGKLFATISKDNTIRMWTMQPPNEGSLLRVFHGHTKPVTGIVWSTFDASIIG
ncbi:MAG: hypothetical protein JNL32_14450, partial [Candidatus Kapabacteria bacterium]|nr:hypothetical protein [Candidatus Kapabacteria bacterium]